MLVSRCHRQRQRFPWEAGSCWVVAFHVVSFRQVPGWNLCPHATRAARRSCLSVWECDVRRVKFGQVAFRHLDGLSQETVGSWPQVAAKLNIKALSNMLRVNADVQCLVMVKRPVIPFACFHEEVHICFSSVRSLTSCTELPLPGARQELHNSPPSANGTALKLLAQQCNFFQHGVTYCL
jgi:hypothetical protein